MFLLAAVDWLHYIFMIPLALLSVFLMLVILVQRGRGGGLTGALGGMGGQSAFGTKAGDLFTRITIIVAAIWVLLSMASIKVLGHRSSTGGLSAAQRGQVTTPAKPGDTSLPAATPSGKAAEADSTSAAPGTTSPAPETAAPPPATSSAPSAAPAPSPAPADAEKSAPGADKP